MDLHNITINSKGKMIAEFGIDLVVSKDVIYKVYCK